MNRAATYHVRMAEGVRGPFTAEQLRDFVEAGVVSCDTEAASSPDGPWMRVDALPERDVVFPPRVQFGFKPRAVAAADASAAEPPLDVRDLIPKVDGPLLRPDFERAPAPPHDPAADAPPVNEVQAMVNEVNALEARFTPPPAPPPKRRLSARLKLVLALVIFGNAVLAAIVLAYEGFNDPWAMLVFKAWFVTYNGAMVILYFTRSTA